MPLCQLDNRDAKLLSLLNRNCRSPLKKLSLELNASKQAIWQRIKRLEQNIIKSYKPVIDQFKIGQENVYLYLKLKAINPKMLNTKLEILKKIKSISWIAKLFGDYDIAISLIYKDRYELMDTIQKVYKQIGKEIQTKEIFFCKNFVIPSMTFNKEYTRVIFSSDESSREKYSITPIQEKILDNLKRDTKSTYLDISENLKISTKTVKKHIQQLEKDKVILGYQAVFDYSAMGFLWTSCLLEIIPGSNISSILKHLQEEENVSWIAVSIEDNIMFDFLSEDYGSLKQFLNNLRIKYEKEIQNSKLININEAIKFDYIRKDTKKYKP